MKQIKRTVDDRLPKWLHSKFLSAVDYIWQVKGDNDESIRRVEAVANSGVFTDEEDDVGAILGLANRRVMGEGGQQLLGEGVGALGLAAGADAAGDDGVARGCRKCQGQRLRGSPSTYPSVAGWTSGGEVLEKKMTALPRGLQVDLTGDSDLREILGQRP